MKMFENVCTLLGFQTPFDLANFFMMPCGAMQDSASPYTSPFTSQQASPRFSVSWCKKMLIKRKESAEGIRSNAVHGSVSRLPPATKSFGQHCRCE